MTIKNISLACTAMFAFLAVPTTAQAQDPGNWTLGFTAYLNDDLDLPCPDIDGVSPRNTVPADGSCTLTGSITEDIVLHPGYQWDLNGGVFIGEPVATDGSGGDPASITILPGTRVLGDGPNSFLVISRGSKIFANGTPTDPIILASQGYEDEDIDTATGTWGGLIINGRSHCNCTSEAEGAGTGEGEVGSGQYGGGATPDLADDSGSLRYIHIYFAGFLVNDEQQLNGIAFQGVGSGTEVEFIQAHNGKDDGMEFFGGSVNVKNIVLTGSADDGFDWTSGWNGKAQHVVVVQNEEVDFTSPDPRGIEADSHSETFDALPRSAPMLANFTLVGPPGDSAWVGNHGMLLRRGTAGNFMNIVISDFEQRSFDIDDAATYTQEAGGFLTLNSILAGSSSQGGALAADGDDGTLAAVFDSGGASDNLIAAPTLQPAAGGSHTYINGATENGMTAIDPSTVDPFFDSVDYVGAVENAAGDWTDGFAFWLHD